VSFRDSVECLLNRPEAFDQHWSRQVDLLMADVIDYDVIGRFERFGRDFDAILRRLSAPPEVVEMAGRTFNATEPVALSSLYTPSLAERVYDYYLADFEAFDYRAESWLPPR
jgi:hypothetical protein